MPVQCICDVTDACQFYKNINLSLTRGISLVRGYHASSLTTDVDVGCLISAVRTRLAALQVTFGQQSEECPIQITKSMMSSQSVHLLYTKLEHIISTIESIVHNRESVISQAGDEGLPHPSAFCQQKRSEFIIEQTRTTSLCRHLSHII